MTVLNFPFDISTYVRSEKINNRDIERSGNEAGSQIGTGAQADQF